MFKMIIPPGVFSFFKILIFWVVRGWVKGQKIAQHDKKIISVAHDISATMHHMIVIRAANV